MNVVYSIKHACNEFVIFVGFQSIARKLSAPKKKKDDTNMAAKKKKKKRRDLT